MPPIGARMEGRGMRAIAMAIVGATMIYFRQNSDLGKEETTMDATCVGWFIATLIVIAGGW